MPSVDDLSIRDDLSRSNVSARSNDSARKNDSAGTADSAGTEDSARTADSARSTMTALQIRVRYFAAAAEAAGLEEEWLRVASTGHPLTVGELRATLAARYGESMDRVMRSGSFLVDGVVSRDDERTILERVDVLPPFAGG